MNIQAIKNILKTTALASIMMGGIALTTTGKVNAQTPPPPPPETGRMARGAPRRDPNLPLPDSRRIGDEGAGIFRAAREQGMRDGELQGTSDRSRNKSYRPDKTGSYKKATNGYLSGTGSKDAYKNSYRQGFLSGYERGYNGEPRDTYDNRPEGRLEPPPPTPPGEDRPMNPRGERPRPPAPNGELPPAPDNRQPPPARRPGDQKPLPRPGSEPAPPPADNK